MSAYKHVYSYTYTLTNKYANICSKTAVLGSIAASVIFIVGISLITTADLRYWYLCLEINSLYLSRFHLPSFSIIISCHIYVYMSMCTSVCMYVCMYVHTCKKAS
jgi:hypothetical protein